MIKIWSCQLGKHLIVILIQISKLASTSSYKISELPSFLLIFLALVDFKTKSDIFTRAFLTNAFVGGILSELFWHISWQWFGGHIYYCHILSIYGLKKILQPKKTRSQLKI